MSIFLTLQELLDGDEDLSNSEIIIMLRYLENNMETKYHDEIENVIEKHKGSTNSSVQKEVRKISKMLKDKKDV